MLRTTVHSTKHQAVEIANTIHLLRLAVHETNQTDFNSTLKRTLEQIQTGKKVIKNDNSTVQTENGFVKLGKAKTMEDNQYKQLQRVLYCKHYRMSVSLAERERKTSFHIVSREVMTQIFVSERFTIETFENAFLK